ncbi:caspase-1-A-like isoform 2-T2 [Discoglossus pictus]
MVDKLTSLRLKIIESCNKAKIEELLDELYDKQVLTEAEVESIKEENNSQRNKCRNMVDYVTKKGDKSSNILLQLLQKDAAISEKLGFPASELPLPIQEQNKQEIKILDEQKDNGLTPCSKKTFQAIHSKDSNIYPMLPKDKRKRQALMICNIKFKTLAERKGAEHDEVGMRILLQGLGYHIESATNLTAEEMRKKMMVFAKMEEHADSDSTFIVFMSHGVKDGICGINSEEIRNQDGTVTVTDLLRTEEIFMTFNNKNCSKLRDKPKVIIIQACRGHQEGQVFASDSAAEPELDDDAFRKVQIESDFICLYSSTPDTVSWRDPKSGSLFIQRLITKMNKDVHGTSLQDLFLEIQCSFRNQLQMPTIERTTLLKKLYLFPGI